MTESILEVMVPEPITLSVGSTLDEAARCMRDRDIGDVIVVDNGKACGLVTDRDIVVRAVAEGRDPSTTKLADICSRELVTLTPADSVEDAVRLMREHAIRRLPIVDDGTPVGIISLGDLAVERDPDSALADISAAAPNT